ncbi:MAG: hypothetical protein U0Q16_27650 [Bryobacteraceae bacterium]
MPIQARIFVGSVITAGIVAGALSAAYWQSANPAQLGLFLLLAAVASAFKVRIPGMHGTITPGFVFVLLGATELSRPETVLLCMLAGLVQSTINTKTRPVPVQAAFNTANLALCGALAHLISHSVAGGEGTVTGLARLVIALVVLFFANVTAVSTVLCLVQSKPLSSIWQLANYWALPYYAAGTLVAVTLTQTILMGWTATLLVVPVLYLIHAYYSEMARRTVIAK